MNKQLHRYFELLDQRPELFANPQEKGAIKIITDPKRILREREKIRQDLQANGKPVEWADIGVLIEDPWYIVIRDIVEFPDGTIGAYIRKLNAKSTIQGGTNVVVLAIHGECIILLHHFRHDERQFFWEVPRGFGEPGIEADKMARIELDEELKIQPTKLIQMVFLPEGIGGTAYYFAKLPEGAVISGGFNEGIGEKILLPLSELNNWIAEGKIMDSYTLNAILLGKIKGLI